MDRRVRQRISSYLSATLLVTLLSSGIVAPEITAEQASANLTQPASPSLDLNNECDQNYISTTVGVAIQKIGNDCVIQFRAAGTYSWRVPKGLTNISRLLVVGGGGAGGLRHGGGGGAGGYVYKENVAVTAHSTLSIVVGEGGGRATARGANGQDSLFNNAFRAKGGGGGADNNSQSGVAGGSGGGSTGPAGVPGASNQSTAGDPTGRGLAGGRGTGNATSSDTNFWTGGGGGGSSSAGETTNGAVNKGGNGGAGTLNDITGEFICYAAGGGGGTNQNGIGGLGGSCIRPVDSAVITSGGKGGNNAWEASFERNLDASPSTGSGGGGGGFNVTRSELGGAGGRGIVVIRYALQTASIDLNAANYPGSGATWPDTSTGRNNGTLQGGPTFVAATANNPAHFKFDGARSQYVSTARVIPSAGPLNFSGGVWFRTTSNQAAKIIGFENTQTGTGTGSYDRHLYIGTDNRLYWGVYDSADRIAKVVKTPQKVNDGRWHYAFFTSTWTYGGNVISISLDNGPAISLSHPGRNQDYGGWWRIGGYMMNGWPNARTGYFTGDIARATIYPWVLTPEQAREKYLEMLSPTKVTALASTSGTAINVSWTPVTGATSYQVNIYNASASALLRSVDVGGVLQTTLTTEAPSSLIANTGYRISVTPTFSSGARKTSFNESEKSEIVVPNDVLCQPERSISGPYTILQFKTSNTAASTSCRWTAPTLTTPLEYLVIGGGGGGGQNHAAGGQGGFYNAGALTNASGSTVTITIGAGGAGAFDGQKDSSAVKFLANAARSGSDGFPSALTTSSSAIVASGGAGGVTTWQNLACYNENDRVTNAWNPAKPGTQVIGKSGLAGGQGGVPRASVGNNVTNSGTVGLQALATSATNVASFSIGGRSGVWASSADPNNGAKNGENGTDHTGNGGQGGGSDCYGGGRGGSGIVILRYLTPLPKAPSPLITLPETMNASLYGRFQASDYNTITKTWKDSSGKGRDVYASRGNPQLRVVNVGTNNAKNDFVAVTGTPAESIPFFALPQNYTLFHVARYNGANKNRIFDGTNTNWLSGFWAGRVGVSFHSDWKTANGLADNKNPETDWIVSTDKRNSYRSQGVDRTTKSASYQFGPLTRFGINDGDLAYAERSDFQVAEVIIYDRELNDSEVAQVESYLQRKYTYQNPDIVGNVAGGGWVDSQYCPAGQVAVGVKSHINNGGFSRFQMICQSIAVGGTQTSGSDSLTSRTDIGSATGTDSSIYCKGSSGTQTSVIKGIRFARGNGLGSQDYYVGGLRLICGPLTGINQSTTESGFFGPAGGAGIDTQTTTKAQYTYYPTPSNPANCPTGQVVVGFNAKSGSVTDAIQIICGVPPLPALNAPVLESVTATLKTLRATWETSSVASSYTIELFNGAGNTLLETSGLANLNKDTNTVLITSANFPTIADSTPYRVRVTANGDGINTLFGPASALSNMETTVSSAAAPSITHQPKINDSDSITVSTGSTITIYETATVTAGTLSYQWTKDGVPIVGATDTNLTLTAVTSDSAGAYRVEVTNSLNGSTAKTTSNPFTLDVLEALTPKSGVVRLDSSTAKLQIQTRGTKTKIFSLLVGGESLTVETATGQISRKAGVGTGAYNARVEVASNGAVHQTDTFTIYYVDSALATPTGASLATGNALKNLVATWNKVESATAYTVLLYDSASTLLTTRGLDSITATLSVDSRSVVINSSNYSGFRDGETYSVRIIALDGTNQLADSDSSSAVTAFTALPASALNLAATVAVSPAGELKIAGSSVTFTPTVTGSGTGTLSYQWYRSGLQLVGETGTTLVIPSLLNSSAGLYTVEVTNTLFGESVRVMSSGQTISVVDGVKINKPINGLVTTVNKPYRLQITTSSGTAPIEFSLDPDYDDLPIGMKFETSTGLIWDTPTTKGFYPLRVVAKDANNSYDTTTVFTISVVETALATASPIARPTANTLKSIDVEWSAVPSANRYLVRLYEDSATATSGFTPLAEVNGITGTSYTLTTSDYVQLDDNTPYKIVVVALDASGSFGDSQESAYTSVRTNSTPAAPVFTTSPTATANGDLGDVISLISLATSAAGTVTYQWSKDGTAIEGQTGRNLVIVSLGERDAGVYSVTATSTLNGVSVSTTAETSTTVSVNFSVETPTVGLTAAVGKDYTLGIRTIGGSSSKTYALAGGTTLPAGLQLNTSTGAITGNPDTVTASTPISVSVTSGSTTQTVSFNLQVVIPSKSKITTVTAVPTPGVLKSIRVDWSKLDATIHMVHLYDNGGSLLKAFVAYDTATGTSLTITDSDFPGLANSTDYKIGVTAVGDNTTGNSVESDQITVRTNSAPERPVFIQQPVDVSGAIGASVTLSAVAAKNDDGVLSYQWFKGNDIIPGAISESLTVASVSVADLANYTVRATNTLNGATERTTSSVARVSVLTDLDAITPISGLKIRTGIPYRLSIESTGGAGDNTWSVIDGILPTGLTLDSKTALITGTPSESLTVGTVYTITLQVRDRYNATSNTEPFVITLVESTSVLATPTLTSNTKATLDTTRSISVEWTPVESATSYSVYLYDSAGTLIKTTGLTGLTGSSIASTTINVNNYPEIAASTKYLVGVVANYDGALSIGASAESTRKEVTTGSNLTPPPATPAPTAPPSSGGGGVVVGPIAPTPQVGPPITIIPGAPFNLQVNAPGANTFAINGGALPAGLTLDPRTGLITGTPTQSGPYSFTILATPPLPGTLITYSGNIVAPPAPTVVPQETIRPGEPVNIQVNVPGANNFTVFGGSLPAGLTIDPRTGLISGTPTQTGPYDFTILATPPAQGTLVRFTGNVEAPAPTPQPVAPIELRPGAAFDFTPNVPGANNFAIRDGVLPAGLTLDPATGRISGTPRESGPYSFSIIATPPANGVLLSFSGTIEAPNSTVVEPVVTPTVQTLDPITPSVSVVPQTNQNLLVVSSAPAGNTTVLPNTGSNGLIITSSEVVLSVAGIRANGNPLPLANGNQLTVQAGLKIEASGTGFLPNSEVFVYMFSTPQLIGKVKTDANGNYSEQLTVPTSLSGNHVLQVNGYLKSNEVKSISLAVIVTKQDAEKTPTTKPVVTKDKKIKIPATGVVVPFKGKVVSLSAANKKLIKQLQMPKNKSKQIYVLGYTSNTGVPRNDILVALNRAINVSKEIQRLNPKVKVGYAGLGTRTSPVCAKQKNICAVVTIR